MIPQGNLRSWTRQVGDQTYTVSTDPSLIDLDAVNAAYGSDMIYWAKTLDMETIKLCVEQSLCFGLYVQKEQPQHESQDGKATNGTPRQSMVGFARLVTDHVTFGYLTDVYVLVEHQGKGLGKWMMRCLEEVLASWPYLRRCLLFTRDESAAKMYRDTIGARRLQETSTKYLAFMERPGTTLKVLDADEGVNGNGGVVAGEEVEGEKR
ncbi:hypothetical protein VTI74DRAFT_816 [Chaetomium olivicolor]